jgi:hypothetical protein
LSIGNLATGEKVLEAAVSDMPPDKFAAFVVAVCRWFSSSVFLAWERQGPGDTFAKHVMDLGYTSIYFPSESETKYSKKPGKTPGFHPGTSNNRSLLLLYRAGLASRDFLNHSRVALNECFEFQNTPKGPKHKQTMAKSDDPSEATENHGDRVIADALCYKMMVEKGGGSARRPVVQAVEPGMFEWHMQNLAKEKQQSRILYADWDKRRRA